MLSPGYPEEQGASKFVSEIFRKITSNKDQNAANSHIPNPKNYFLKYILTL